MIDTSVGSFSRARAEFRIGANQQRMGLAIIPSRSKRAAVRRDASVHARAPMPTTRPRLPPRSPARCQLGASSRGRGRADVGLFATTSGRHEPRDHIRGSSICVVGRRLLARAIVHARERCGPRDGSRRRKSGGSTARQRLLVSEGVGTLCSRSLGRPRTRRHDDAGYLWPLGCRRARGGD